MRAPPGLFATGLMTIGCWVRGGSSCTVVGVHITVHLELSFQRTRSLTRLCSRDRVHAIVFNKTTLSTRDVSFTIHVTSMRVGAGGGTTADSYSTDVCIRSEAMFVPTTTSEPPNIAYLTRS